MKLSLICVLKFGSGKKCPITYNNKIMFLKTLRFFETLRVFNI